MDRSNDLAVFWVLVSFDSPSCCCNRCRLSTSFEWQKRPHMFTACIPSPPDFHTKQSCAFLTSWISRLCTSFCVLLQPRSHNRAQPTSSSDTKRICSFLTLSSHDLVSMPNIVLSSCIMLPRPCPTFLLLGVFGSSLVRRHTFPNCNRFWMPNKVVPSYFSLLWSRDLALLVLLLLFCCKLILPQLRPTTNSD